MLRGFQNALASPVRADVNSCHFTRTGFSALDVTPTIYMADGTALDLPAVHVPQASVATVDVNAALAQIPADIQPHLSSYGSAAIRYRYDWQGAAHAAMSILDLPRSLEYAYEFVFPPGQGANEKGYPAQAMAARNALNAQAYEGLWFRRTTSAGGFLALANVSASALTTNVTLSGLRQPAGRSVSLPSHSTALIDLGGFFAGDSATFGGITISQSGSPGDLQLAGGLQDLTTGYSTNLPLIPAKISPGPTASRQYASVGMMVNQQDPMLNFPAGLTFYPYAFVRNIASASRTLSFTAYYMDNGHVKSLPLPDLTLAPGQVAELPVHDILVKQTQVEDMNLVFSYSGDFGDILAATGSTDTAGNYVFPVGPQPISPSGAKKSIYWTTSGGFDTMYTVWNPGNVAEDLLVTLHYGANGDTYRLPLHLEPYASEMFDIGELIRTQQLDEDGKTMPFDAAQGSVIVGSAAGAPEDLINIAFAGGIYNPTKATCGGTCQMCQVGLTDEGMNPGGFYVTVGGQRQSSFFYMWSDGTRHDVTNSSTWYTGSYSIATVQSMGQSYPGLTTGVGGGTTPLYANYGYQVPIDTGGQVCGNPPVCPTIVPSQQGVVTVQIPTGSRLTQNISSHSINASNFPSGCTGTQVGWFREVWRIVTDQLGADIVIGGQNLSETITVGTPNDLRVNGEIHGIAVTNANGIYDDKYYVCTDACPGSSGQTNASQGTTDVASGHLYNLSPNALVYTCTSITVNGQ
jgi:hypothetical protein